MFGNVTAQEDDLATCMDGGTTCHEGRNGYMALLDLKQPANGGYSDPAIPDSDNWLSAKDRDWKKLRIWIDENRDGIAQPEELHRLEEFGIYSLSLMPAVSYWKDKWGNSFRYTAPINVGATEIRPWWKEQDKNPPRASTKPSTLKPTMFG
jgi:hypothetical protein